jgi:phosphate starvation-inducible membrane PsiE
MGIIIVSSIICCILCYNLCLVNKAFNETKKVTNKKYALNLVYSVISGMLIYFIIWQFIAGLTLYAYEYPNTKLSKKIQVLFEMEINK